jgi:hypothetical protein
MSVVLAEFDAIALYEVVTVVGALDCGACKLLMAGEIDNKADDE